MERITSMSNGRSFNWARMATRKKRGLFATQGTRHHLPYTYTNIYCGGVDTTPSRGRLTRDTTVLEVNILNVFIEFLLTSMYRFFFGQEASHKLHLNAACRWSLIRPRATICPKARTLLENMPCGLVACLQIFLDQHDCQLRY